MQHFQISFALLRLGEAGHGCNLTLWRQLCVELVKYKECRIPAVHDNDTGDFLLGSGSVVWNKDLHLLGYNGTIAHQNWLNISARLNNVRR